MPKFKLNFYGVGGEVSCDDSLLCDELRRDFEYFVVSDCDPAFSIRLDACPVPPGRVPARRAAFRGDGYSAYDRGGVRTVDYQGRALAVLDFRTESAELFSPDRELLRELGYLLIASRAGFLMDLRGLHRVHALGLAHRGRGALVLLPSGGGKTALFLDLFKTGKTRLLSEDTPLVSRDGMLHPFPLRLGLTPQENVSEIPKNLIRTMVRRRHGRKLLVDLPYFKSVVSGPVVCGLVVVGRRGAGASPSVRRLWRPGASGALLSSLVVGWGVPQLTEFMLRTDAVGLGALVKIAASRAVAMGALLRRSRTARCTLGTDRSANADALLELMDDCLSRD